MWSHRNVIRKYGYIQCLEDRNGLSAFCSGLSKYGRTSLYDLHQNTLKNALHQSWHLNRIVAVFWNALAVTKAKPWKNAVSMMGPRIEVWLRPRDVSCFPSFVAATSQMSQVPSRSRREMSVLENFTAFWSPVWLLKIGYRTSAAYRVDVSHLMMNFLKTKRFFGSYYLGA